jgi:acyl-CoA synthetase (AMP-forming)/AMP-acid ligase II
MAEADAIVLMTDYLDRGAVIAGDAACMLDPDGTVLMTHREFQDATHRIAASLLADGLTPGERVAIFSPNDPWAFACVVGVMRAGGVWCAVNAGNSDTDIAEFLHGVGCSRLLFHPSLEARVGNVLAGLPHNAKCMALGTALESQIAPFPPGTRVPPPSISDDQPALLVGTGGTTGKPKAVPVSHRQMSLMCLAFNAHLVEEEPPRYICATPMTHAAGGAAFPVIAEGGSVVVHQGVVPAQIFDSIERNRITRIFLPPTALYSLLGQPDVHARDFASLRHFLLAASPVAPERLAEAVDVFGPVMVQVYGQSEAPFILTVLSVADIAQACVDPLLRHRLASCGKPSLVAQLAIMDDTGNLLAPGELGEIVVRSDLVFSGYWENEEATTETRRPNGWHGTGDMGVLDSEGYVYIRDRKKDMIISGGFNVFPAEVEAVIQQFTEVNDCAVIGVPDAKWGERVLAVIELKGTMRLDPQTVVSACREALGAIKAPKEIVFQDLPRSAVGKVLKRELREGYWAGQARRV